MSGHWFRRWQRKSLSKDWDTLTAWTYSSIHSLTLAKCFHWFRGSWSWSKIITYCWNCIIKGAKRWRRGRSMMAIQKGFLISLTIIWRRGLILRRRSGRSLILVFDMFLSMFVNWWKFIDGMNFQNFTEYRPRIQW